MNKKRIPQIITASLGVLALVGVSVVGVSIAEARSTPPPVEAGIVTGQIDLDAVGELEAAALVAEEIANTEAARIEAERVAAEQAAAAQAEADRIAAEQAAEQEREAAPPVQGNTNPGTNPGTAPAPAPVFSCPPGAVDAGDGASCWWEYCFSIQPIPNPDYPECDSTFKP